MAEQFSVVINGVTTNLSYDSSTGKWTGMTTASSVSSWAQTDHKYPVSLSYTNAAGTNITADPSDLSHCSGVVADDLKLRVHERVAPVVTITSPNNDDWLNTGTVTVSVNVTDNDSGVDETSLVVKFDGSVVTMSGSGGTYTGTVTGLADGSHTVTATCSDNDGNVGTAASVTFSTDTAQPTLTVSSPAEGAIFNVASVAVAGVATDAAGGEIDTVTVALNGGSPVTVTVAGDGSFSETVTFVQGTNTIVVIATDKAGNDTVITRTVTADLSVPVITSFRLIPNPVDCGATLTIEATVGVSS